MGSKLISATHHIAYRRHYSSFFIFWYRSWTVKSEFDGQIDQSVDNNSYFNLLYLIFLVYTLSITLSFQQLIMNTPFN